MTDSSDPAPPPPPSDSEVRAFAETYRRFLDWIASAGQGGNEVVALVRRVLGPDGLEQSVVRRQLGAFEHVNLQTAFDAWSREAGRTVVLHGIAVPPFWPGLSIQQLVTAEMLPPIRFTAPALIERANGPGSTLGCAQLALAEVSDAAGDYLVLLKGPEEHDEHVAVEVAGLPRELAQSTLAELDDLRRRLNVYRCHVLDVGVDPRGNLTLTFAEPPRTSGDDVVLPDAVLERVERHALGVAEHREALLEVGQHLKRGLLLYGPPGTGKTHTARYLFAAMTDYTRLVLTGRSLRAVGSVAEIARELQPAVVLLEDVDLVAEDRSLGDGSNPVLYDLLDAMDGAAPDADLLFLLTTNRPDLLEPALAARPGRIDVAVEIERPDARGRRRLVQLYGRGIALELTDTELADLVERTEGVTASFVKELLRRAVLEALREDASVRRVTATQLSRALDDLLDGTQQVTRSLLGAADDGHLARVTAP